MSVFSDRLDLVNDVTPDGKRVAGKLVDRQNEHVSCWIWDRDSAAFRALPAADEAFYIWLSPDGRFLAAAMDGGRPAPWLTWLYDLLGLTYETDRSHIAIIDVDSGQPVAWLPDASYAQFSPDGRTLAVSTTDNQVQLWDFPLHKPWGKIARFAVVAGLWVFLLGRWRAGRTTPGQATADAVAARSA